MITRIPVAVTAALFAVLPILCGLLGCDKPAVEPAFSEQPDPAALPVAEMTAEIVRLRGEMGPLVEGDRFAPQLPRSGQSPSSASEGEFEQCLATLFEETGQASGQDGPRAQPIATTVEGPAPVADERSAQAALRDSAATLEEQACHLQSAGLEGQAAALRLMAVGLRNDASRLEAGSPARTAP